MHITSWLHNLMAMDVFIHPRRHTGFNRRVTVVHLNRLHDCSRNLPGQSAAVAVPLLSAPLQRNAGVKDDWSPGRAAAPTVSMLQSGHKDVGTAVLYRQVFPAHLVVCVGSRDLYPAPGLLDPGQEYIDLQQLQGLR